MSVVWSSLECIRDIVDITNSTSWSKGNKQSYAPWMANWCKWEHMDIPSGFKTVV